MVIEKSFGLLKRRFPALRHGLRFKKPEDACILITSALVLHNMLVDMRDSDEFSESSEEETLETGEENSRFHAESISSGTEKREFLIRTYF